MAKLCMAHESTHGARKPSGPKKKEERLNDGDNNGQATHCNATSCGARKAAWANSLAQANSKLVISTTLIVIVRF